MAATRAAKNKELRRAALRDELKSREYLRQVHGLLEKDWDEKKVPEYKAKMDGYFRLLRKTLPDLNSVEWTGGDGEPLSIKVSYEKPDAN